MMIGTKEQFFQLFAATARAVSVVELPGGESIYVRELSAHERSQYDLAVTDKAANGMESLRERLVVLCACDVDGKRVFGDADTTFVGNLPASVVEPIFTKAREVNGFLEKPVEEIRKNSDPGMSGV